MYESRTVFPSTSDGRPRLRGVKEPFSFLLAVDKDLRIRTLRFGLNGRSSALSADPMISEAGRLVGWRNVRVSDDRRRLGWRHLEEVYAEDYGDESEGAEWRRNMAQVYAWYEVANAKRGGKIKKLDAAYLPPSLREVHVADKPPEPISVQLEPPVGDPKRRTRKADA